MENSVYGCVECTKYIKTQILVHRGRKRKKMKAKIVKKYEDQCY